MNRRGILKGLLMAPLAAVPVAAPQARSFVFGRLRPPPGMLTAGMDFSETGDMTAVAILRNGNLETLVERLEDSTKAYERALAIAQRDALTFEAERNESFYWGA